MKRCVYKFWGKDLEVFFQGILTQTVINLQKPVYACMLTPQGRFFCDFFIIPSEDGWLIEIDSNRAEEILKKLALYRLRSEVLWEKLNLDVSTSLSALAESYQDPRHKEMGYRFHVSSGERDEDYNKRRFSLGLAEDELIPGKSIILEYQFDHFNVFSWEKGCYIGQELMARTRYLGALRKRVFGFECKEGICAYHDVIFTKEQKEAGKILSFEKPLGLAMMYTAFIEKDLFLGDGSVILLKKTVLE